MAKIKIDSGIYERIKKVTETAGYSSTEEFITHIIETELAKYETADEDTKVADELRGLGYIE